MSVSECLQASCKCTVNIQGIDDAPQSVIFSAVEGDISVGYVIISNLESNTNYTAALTCNNDPSSDNKNLPFKTDYGHPSAPQNVSASLVSGHVKITWSPPAAPADSFNNYVLGIHNKLPAFPITKENNSYQVPDVYEDGIKYTFYVKTCYKNNQDHSICSKQEQRTFFVPATAPPPSSPISNTSPTTTTTTTTKSSDAHITSISITMLLLSLLLIVELFW